MGLTWYLAAGAVFSTYFQLKARQESDILRPAFLDQSAFVWFVTTILWLPMLVYAIAHVTASPSE